MFLDAGDNSAILKKYSPIVEMCEFAKEYTESLYQATGYISLIGDKTNIVSASGVFDKKLYIYKPIWDWARKAIEERKTLFGSAEDMPEEFKYKTQVVAPIICKGEAIGVVGLMSERETMGIIEQKLVETVALFISSQVKD